MTENTPQGDSSPPVKPSPSFRKGTLVKVNRKAYLEHVENLTNGATPPAYIFDGPGEILTLKGEYGQVRWRRPVPDVWLKVDLLEIWK